MGSSRLGFLLGIQGDAAKQLDPDGNVVSNQGPLKIDFGAGFGFAVGSGDMDLGLKIGYAMTTDEDNEGARSENSQFDLDILMRGTFSFSGPHELVPFAGITFKSGSGGLKIGDPPQYSGMNFGLMAGTDIRLNLADGIFVQPGVGMAFSMYKKTESAGGNETVETTNNLVAPFYNVAVEVRCWEWMSMRFGGGQSVIFNSNSKENSDGSQGSKSASEVEHHISTGVGFHLPHGVNLDVQVDTGWWQKGPYLVTGDGGNFGAHASLSKDW